MEKEELFKENEKLKFLLKNHIDYIDKKENDLFLEQEKNKNLKLVIEKFKEELIICKRNLKIKDENIEALEKETLGRIINDLRNGVKKKEANGEIIFKRELSQEWYKLFLELPTLTRNRILLEAENNFDEKQSKIPSVKEYLLKEVYIPKVLYDKKMFLASEKQKEGFEKNRIYNLKVKKEKLKKEYLEIKEILKQSELMK